MMPAPFIGRPHQEAAEARRFLREVHAAAKAAGYRGKARRPESTPLLTLEDIEGFLHVKRLMFHVRSRPPKGCPHACQHLDQCTNCRAMCMHPALYQGLQAFAVRWRAGEICKIKLSDGWQLVDAQVLARLPIGSPGRPAGLTQRIGMSVDPRTLKLKLG
jgi:hypothetical protein